MDAAGAAAAPEATVNSKLQTPNSKLLSILVRLRPRDVGAILDQAVVLYRRNFFTYVGIVALMQVPVTLLLTLGNIFLLDPANLRTPQPPRFGADPNAYAQYDAASAAWFSDLISRSLLLFALSGVGVILLNLATGALARAIADGYMGRPLSVLGAYRAVLPRFWSLTGLIVLLGFSLMLFVVPPLFFWIFISWSFASQAVVLEGRGVASALQRSWDLVRGDWWRVFGTYLLLFLVRTIITLPASVASVALSLVGASWVVQNIGAEFASLVLAVISTPIQLTAMTLLYFDLRVRKEGYDLNLALDAQAVDLGLEPAAIGGGWPYQAVAPAAGAGAPAGRAMAPLPYGEVTQA
ncbi:MAG TPA: hypothetical protein VKY74_14285 [Chloroflexia bacterium]|nr:hypothetical protein [Chloroflexia bacterium]